MKRRDFLDFWIRFASTGLGMFVLYPVARYLVPPKIPEATSRRVVAAKKDELAPGKFKIFVFGGFKSDFTVHRTHTSYNTATNTWQSLGNMPADMAESHQALAADVGLILHTNVRIGYEAPWRQVEAMLLEAASRTPGLRESPLPFVLQKNLGDFAVDYEINVHTDNTRAIGVTYTALHRNILDVFNEHGVQIMTPAYEGDPEQKKVVPREKWFTAPAKPVVGDRVVENVVPSVPADARLDRSPDGEGDRSRPT